MSTDRGNFLNIDKFIIISTSIIRGASGGQHTVRKEVWLMAKLFAFIIAWLSDIKSITITIRKK